MISICKAFENDLGFGLLKGLIGLIDVGYGLLVSEFGLLDSPFGLLALEELLYSAFLLKRKKKDKAIYRLVWFCTSI